MSNSTSWLNSYCYDKQKGKELNYNNSRLFHYFSLLAKSRFRWDNLPSTIDSLHIEKYLFQYGEIAFFEDKKDGFKALPINPNGGVNLYGEHQEYIAVGVGYSKALKLEDMIKIRANDDSIPAIYNIRYYADMIDEIEKTAYMNLRQQKFPFIVATTKVNELTMRNIYNKVDTGEQAIFVDDRIANGGNVGLEVLQTNAPYLLKDLQEYKNTLMNELLTWLGLNNTNNDKKERMLVSEVNVNNNHILMNMELEYKNRLLAAEQINKKYGLNIEVKKVINELEVNFNGEIYSGIEDDNK